MGSAMPSEEIDVRFNLHPPRDDSVGAWMDSVRAEYTALAHFVNDTLFPSREASLAVTALEESLFWAIGAIARRGQ